MKRRLRITSAVTTVCALTVLNMTAVSAAVDTETFTKDASYIEKVTGNTDIDKKVSILISDENASSVTTKTVKINKQKIKDGGNIKISDETEEKYENVKTPVLVSLDVAVDTPIISGDTELTMEHNVTRKLENCDIGKMYVYDVHYSNPVRIPNLK